MPKGPSTQRSGNNKGQGVTSPFPGLYNDRPAHMIPPNGFQACNNVRVEFGEVTSHDCGWHVQHTAASMNIPAPSTSDTQIYGGGLFPLLANFEYLIAVTSIDVLAFNNPTAPSGYSDTNGFWVYITPTYIVGTATCAGGTTAVSGSGTAWNTASGVGFRNNVRAGDYISFKTQTARSLTGTDGGGTGWIQIASVSDDTDLVLSSNGPNTSGAVNYTIRQCLSNSPTSPIISMEVFPNAGTPDTQDLLFIANRGGTQTAGVDPIFKWKPTAAHGIYMNTLDFTCGVLRRFNNVLIYGRLYGVGGGGTPLGVLGATSIQSSDNGVPVSVNTGVAFQGMVSDGPDPIQYLGVMGNQLLIYCGGARSYSQNPTIGGSVIAANFVGGSTTWQFQTVVRGRGPMGPKLVAEFADRHQFIANDGEYRYNGMFLQVMNDHIYRSILQNVDYGSFGPAFLVQDPFKGTIIWVLPTQPTLPNEWEGWSEHYMEQANNYLFKPITKRQVQGPSSLIQWTCWLGSNPNASVLSLSPKKGALIGTSEGTIIDISGGYDQMSFGGTLFGYVSSVQFASQIVAGERARGLVKRVYPFLDEAATTASTITVTLKMADRIGAAAAITDAQTFTIGTTPRFTTHYRRGRVGNVTFSFTSASSGPSSFTLEGFDVDLPQGSPGGQR